jgi:protein ImuB
MFDGIGQRVVCAWFPRLASDRALRLRPLEGLDDAPFALTLKQNNANRLYCLNQAAERQGLYRGMAYSDARAFCPDLQSRPAEPDADRAFLQTLHRWALRYCPWVGFDGEDGLVLRITGAAHLFGGEEALLAQMQHSMAAAGISLKLGLADTRGAAWALAHYAPAEQAQAVAGETLRALGTLPVSALRLDEKTVVALQRLGLRDIASLAASPRAPLARRFGPALFLRLDQALGELPEALDPAPEPPHFGVRLTLPEPIGLTADVMAGTQRLLEGLCAKLKAQEMGALRLCLTLRRVDQASLELPLRLARPMREPASILPLFERSVTAVDAGYGIDQLRLEARLVEPLSSQQTSYIVSDHGQERLDDLITRLGTRIGLENIQRFVPNDTHMPERSFRLLPAVLVPAQPLRAWTQAPNGPASRPLRIFPAEPIEASGNRPPQRFTWRRLALTTARAIGPERIAPDWWSEEETWSTGLRDYWRVETQQGRRLWLYYTPQRPAWFVQGEFA